MAKRIRKKPTEKILVPRGAINQIAQDLNICRDTVTDALSCKSTSFAAYLIQRIAIKFYEGR